MKSNPALKSEMAVEEFLALPSKRNRVKDFNGERALAFQLMQNEIRFVAQYRWQPGSTKRADFAIFSGPGERPDFLVEVLGGVFAKTPLGHSSGVGITRDCERWNAMLLLNYRVIVVTSEHVKSGYAMRTIKQALTQL